MPDSNSLLATLSQSSAAIVAIIGGFLVSRLVALSSEREGIKRQLKAARERLALYQTEYGPVHEYRLSNSVAAMEDWLLDKLIDERAENKDTPIDTLVEVPRGSSLEEMLPYAEALNERVDLAYKTIIDVLTDGDTDRIEIEALRKRGLTYEDVDEDLYERVFDSVRDALPEPVAAAGFGVVLPNFASRINLNAVQPAWSHEVEMRRLDESIREETQLSAQLNAAEQELARLSHDLDVFAQPVGVVPAVWILTLFSVLGIVLPLGFMAFGPSALGAWITGSLLGCFVVGLAAVLFYIVWYLRLLSKEDAPTDRTKPDK